MFRVYRRAQGQPHPTRKKLRPLRKGVAEIPLRAQVSQEVNNRLMGNEDRCRLETGQGLNVVISE